MVFAGAWFQQTLAMEVITIGRAADNLTEDCLMEVGGRWLFFRIALRGGWVWLSVCLMDEGDEPQLLLNVGDGPEGWRTICRLVAALERNQIKSLEPRPLEIGESGSPDSWVIA
jgi:hypothetical protein